MEDNYLFESFKDILSSESEGISFKEGSDFDCGLKTLSSLQRKERLAKIRLLHDCVFSNLDKLEEEIYMVSKLEICSEWNGWQEWFEDFIYAKRMKKNVFYREIIAEANKRNIQLLTRHVISYKENKALADKFFRGNMEYITKVCFCVPKLDLVVQPTHSVQLLLYSKNKDSRFVNFRESLLSCSDELKPWG